MLSTNVVSAKAASPSGPGSATFQLPGARSSAVRPAVGSLRLVAAVPPAATSVCMQLPPSAFRTGAEPALSRESVPDGGASESGSSGAALALLALGGGERALRRRLRLRLERGLRLDAAAALH